jgi:cullin-4
MKAYKDSLGPDIPSLLSVNILTAGNWPTYSKSPVRLPDNLQRELDRFIRFYKAKYTGRSLTFVHSLDHCTLRVEFDKGSGGGRKELNVSFHQAVILLLFETLDKDAKLGFKEIVDQTGLGRLQAVRIKGICKRD